MINKDRMLFLDIETGGIGLDKSLLTAHFDVTTPAPEYKTLDSLSLALKPKDGIYVVTGESLEINRINLVQHDKTAIPYSEGGTKLYNFLKANAVAGKLIPAGHGIRMDILHICDKLVSSGTWDTFVSYHYVDTGCIARFLSICNVLPNHINGSLSSLYEYFAGEIPGQIHTAETDVYMAKRVLFELTCLIKEMNYEQI